MQKAKEHTPAAASKHADTKADSKSGSRSHARDDASASVRKRGREGERAVKDDRKAPRTEHKADARSSQSHRDRDRDREKEKDREREREKDKGREKDRDRASDRDRGTRANGDAPTGVLHKCAVVPLYVHSQYTL